MPTFEEFVDNIISELTHQVQIAIKLECDEKVVKSFQKSIEISKKIKKAISKYNVKVNYLNQLHSDLNNLRTHFLFKAYRNTDFIDEQSKSWKVDSKKRFHDNNIGVSRINRLTEFNLVFFDQIGYFENNIVAIGANGSGKTTLANKFKSYLKNNGLVISAQRILRIPSFDSIANYSKTASDLKKSQIRDKSYKSDKEYNLLQQEFSVVLRNLLAENIAASNNYRKAAIKSVESGENISKPDKTNLDKTIDIWNSLIKHRRLDCSDGINFKAYTSDKEEYPAISMSDGEKVLLFLISQVLQAPEDGFIVIDEPEMYLHKTILKQLWNILESNRPDCIFIYLTHDLDFATSRTTAKKIWIKSFNHPDEWTIENISSDEIPESLMLELLGSRNNILFCEGEKGSIDEMVYSILFPELTIIPVKGCFNVINHTKAFNQINSTSTRAFGLIDSDYHDQNRLNILSKSNIYSFNAAEVENLFFDEEFLKGLINKILAVGADVDKIKLEVIKKLESQKNLQASHYVSTKVNYHFTDSDISKGADIDKLESNYEKFLEKVDIKAWYDKRIDELERIIKEKDYQKTLKVFNNKGLKTIANKHLNIGDFINRSIRFLQNDDDAKNALLKYFPQELSNLDDE